MSKRNLVIGTGLVALVVLALFYLLRGDAPPDPDEAASGSDAAAERRALVERKRTDREGRKLELSAPSKVTGIVTRASDGQGVSNAVVMLTRKAITQDASSEPGEPAAPLQVVTDDAGEFSVPGVPAGRYVISATARGFLPAQRNDIRIRPGQDDPRISLSLETGGYTLSGTVSDIGGGPIEEVLVSVNDRESSNLFGVRYAPPASLTDEDGHYEINLPNGAYVVTTYHPDYVATFRMAQIMDAPHVEDLQLTPGASIEGTVLARGSNEPVADAVVTFQDGRNGNAGGFRMNMSSDGRMVRTGPDGRFRLSGVHPGVAQVEARAARGASRESLAVPVGIGESVTGIELVLDEAYTISGFVVPKDDLEGAVEGVMVGAYSISPPSLTVAVAPTDAEGYFEILGMLPGRYTVGAMGEDILPNISGASAVINDKDITDVLVKMDVGYRIKGRVDPASLAKVSLSIDMDEMSLGKILDTIAVAFAQTTADAEGNFDLGPVKDGSYTLVADAPDGSHGEQAVTVEGADLEGITLAMEPRASVAGTVVDEAGTAQPGLTVRMTRIDGDGPSSAIMMRGPFGDGAVPTADDGSFVARGLEAGRYTVLVRDDKSRMVAWADDLGKDEPEAMVLEVAQGEDQTGLVLRVQSRSGVLSGTVVDADGAPVADAWVTASMQVSSQDFGELMSGPSAPNPDEPERLRGVEPPRDDADQFELPGFFAERPVLTDELGRFTVIQLRPSQRYSIVAEGEKGGARGRVEDLRPSRSDVLVQLEAVAGISGVVTADGKPVEQYTVRVEGPSDRNKSVFSTDGKFRIERIDPGEYSIEIISEQGVALRDEIEVQADQTTELKIELEDYGTIEGTLVDAASGDPIAGVAVMVQPDEGRGDASQALAMLMGGGSKTDAQGRFEATKVAPGKGRVSFVDTSAAMSQGGGQVGMQEYEIDAGETLDLGTIKGVSPVAVESDQRGKYGLGVTVATHAKRPRPPGTDLEDEDEDDVDPDSTPRLWVSYVEVGGPAHAQGIVPGDEVTAVDSQPAAMLGPHAASILIKGPQVKVDDTLALDLVHDGSTRSVTLRAQPKKKPSATGADGD